MYPSLGTPDLVNISILLLFWFSVSCFFRNIFRWFWVLL